MERPDGAVKHTEVPLMKSSINHLRSKFSLLMSMVWSINQQILNLQSSKAAGGQKQLTAHRHETL
jgi:hypothetical protein